jgi:hypothetical protein
MRPKARTIFIGIPSVDGNINVALLGFLSILDALTLNESYPLAFIRRTMPYTTPVEYARNRLVRCFLEDTSADTLWFLDADVVPTLSSLRIFETDADLLTGRCFIWRHELEGQPQLFINSFDLAVDPKGQPCLEPIRPVDASDVVKDVEAAGTACLLIKRRVFEDPRMLLESRWTDVYGGEHDLDEDRNEPDWAPPFFRTSRKPNGQVYLGEDIDFTKRARALGYTMKAHLAASFGHRKMVDLDGIAALYGNWLERTNTERAAAAVAVA